MKADINRILHGCFWILALILVAWLVSACEPTRTVVVTVTPPPTMTVDPTPTREVVEALDCQTLTLVTDEFPAVNANPCFMVAGSLLIPDRAVETPDGRQWDRLDEYQIVYRPGGADTPPWVFWNDLGGSHARGLRMEIDQINGEFGYSQSGIFLHGSERYILKIEGWSEIINAGAASVALAGEVHYGDGQSFRLDERYISQAGPVEVLWVIETDQPYVNIRWDAWIDITWASAFGAFTWQGMRVEVAPSPDWGDDLVIVIE